jgi:hypothetical protein
MTLIALTFLPVAFGQPITAALVGTVRDNSGAAINDAKVPVNTTTQPGSVAQTVTVSDQAPLLQTGRADISAQVESKQAEDLPIGSGATRNFQAPESLMPGVSRQSTINPYPSMLNIRHSSR